MQKLLVVLGKRLSNDTLTLEGRSRVEALVSHLVETQDTQLIVAFSGGVTFGNTQSEARAMYDYFLELSNQLETQLVYRAIILEEESQSTVQNIQNVAEKVVKSELFTKGMQLELQFLSNDYHLLRMMQIQQWMDEQGLLRLLKSRIEQVGISVVVSHDILDHLTVAYPHDSLNGEIFLKIDDLTPYRVFLEGVVANAFQRDLLDVVQPSQQLALEALAFLNVLESKSAEFPLLAQLLPVLESLISSSYQEILEADFQDRKPNSQLICSFLAALDTNLTLLNRYTDPEIEHSPGWWKGHF